MRSLQTGRLQHWTTRDAKAADMAAPLCEKIVVNDPSAMRESALLVLGVALLAVPDVLPAREEGALLRLVPRWYSDVGAISIYFASRSLLPAKPAFLSTGSRKHSGSDDCPNAFRAACHEPPTWLTSEIANFPVVSELEHIS
jgi:DNA-binding transcriptional LysR family regulator